MTSRQDTLVALGLVANLVTTRNEERVQACWLVGEGVPRLVRLSSLQGCPSFTPIKSVILIVRSAFSDHRGPVPAAVFVHRSPELRSAPHAAGSSESTDLETLHCGVPQQITDLVKSRPFPPHQQPCLRGGRCSQRLPTTWQSRRRSLNKS